MSRNSRQNKILEIIATKDIDRQEDLVAELKNLGYNVTQATVSRDIKELNIIKVSVNGRQKYAKEQVSVSTPSKLEDMVSHAVVYINYAINIVVIKTISASANVVALLIDHMNDDTILGTIAGDDTLFVVTKNEDSAVALCEKVSNIVNG